MPYLINMHAKSAKSISLRIKNETVIGREDTCDLQCLDEAMSREHFIIFHKSNDEFFIKDNGSSNGTYLNNNKLISNSDYKLTVGDIIVAGEQSFFYCEKKPQQNKFECKECQAQIKTYLAKDNLKCPVCDGEVS